MSFHDFELDYLRDQRVGRLATVRPDGTLQNSPVGYRYNAELGTIDIGGYDNSTTHKYRNVAANGRAAFVVDDVPSTDPWRVRCLEIRATGEVVGDVIRLHPRRIISFGIDQPDAGPHELRTHARDVG